MTPPLPQACVFASTNAHKRRELQQFFHQATLPLTLEALPPDFIAPEEPFATFLENARFKVQQAWEQLPAGTWVLAEDSGFIVPGLAGRYDLDPFPGVQSNRWMTLAVRQELLGSDALAEPVTDPQRNAGILKLLEGHHQREAQYVCAMVLGCGEHGVVFETQGLWPLWVVDEMRGAGGFGYDPIVTPLDEMGQPEPGTVAELSSEEKTRRSHRGQALRALADFLQQVSV